MDKKSSFENKKNIEKLEKVAKKIKGKMESLGYEDAIFKLRDYLDKTFNKLKEEDLKEKPNKEFVFFLMKEIVEKNTEIDYLEGEEKKIKEELEKEFKAILGMIFAEEEELRENEERYRIEFEKKLEKIEEERKEASRKWEKYRKEIEKYEKEEKYKREILELKKILEERDRDFVSSLERLDRFYDFILGEFNKKIEKAFNNTVELLKNAETPNKKEKRNRNRP